VSHLIYIQYLTFTYKLSDIYVFKQFLNDIPPIVSLAKDFFQTGSHWRQKKEVF